MNCLNKSSVGAGAGAKAGPCARVALGLAGGGAGVPKSVLEELGLLERVDLLESSLAHLWATLWVAAPCRGPGRQDDGGIIQMIE